MKQLLSKSEGIVGAGEYLAGAYRFAGPTTLAHAIVTLKPPTLGVMSIGLEIDGELDPAVVFSVTTLDRPDADFPNPDVLIDRLLDIAVPAGAFIRWKVTEFTQPVEDGPLQASVSFAYTEDVFVQDFLPSNRLSVRWVNGEERFILFDYDADQAVFFESDEASGLSASRAIIATHGKQFLSMSIQGSEVLRLSSGVLSVAAIEALGGVAPSEEMSRLEFMVNGGRIATLTSDGVLRVAGVDTTAERTAPEDGFAFYSRGVLGATLTEKFLLASGIAML